jgi:hypothetical protein
MVGDSVCGSQDDELSKTAAKLWSNAALAKNNPPAFKADVVQDIYKTVRPPFPRYLLVTFIAL